MPLPITCCHPSLFQARVTPRVASSPRPDGLDAIATNGIQFIQSGIAGNQATARGSCRALGWQWVLSGNRACRTGSLGPWDGRRHNPWEY